MSKGFVAWHPDVHERFGGRLFFFLIALNSFDEGELRKKLKTLFDNFGIATEPDHEGYCAYEVFGEFDYLLRVWLPADKDTKFLKEARQHLPVQAILQFTVQSVVSDWRFDLPPDPDTVQNLDRAEIMRVQQARAEGSSEKFMRRGVAHWVPYQDKHKAHAVKSIKAFVCMRGEEVARGQILTVLQEKLVAQFQQAQGVHQCTIHRGVGFAGLLAKVVTNDFHALATLVRGISKEFGKFGVSTSTYAVTYRLAEGDDIRAEALVSDKSTMEQVEEFCPALRETERLARGESVPPGGLAGSQSGNVSLAAQPGEPGKQFRHEVARFIEQRVLPADLNEANRSSMRSLLEAVLWGNEEKAMEILYLPTIRTERAIRERLLKLANRLDGGIKTLIRKLEERKQDVKTPENITLGACLLGARDYVRPELPNSIQVKEFPDAEINAIANTRNKLMHGGTLSPQKHWKILAEYLLSLFRAQEIFVAALDESLAIAP